jgi:predicted alpha/beta-fold hydrolase
MLPGGHLQTIAGGVIRPAYPVGLPAPSSKTVAVADGASLRIELTPNHEDSPIVVMFHGFMSDANSPVMLRTMEEAYGRGYTVVRVNLRNAGGTYALSKGLFTLLQWPDVGHVLVHLKAVFPRRRMYAIGISIGGSFLLNQLAREPRFGQMLRGVVAVNPPIDVLLSAAQMCLPENWVYMRRFLASRLGEVRAKRAQGEDYGDPETPRIRTVPEFDTKFILGETGMASLAEYYAAASSKDFLPQINVPTMIVASRDDPIVSVSMFQSARLDHSSVVLNIVDRGGHLGFLYWKRGRIRSWAAEASMDFMNSL